MSLSESSEPPLPDPIVLADTQTIPPEVLAQTRLHDLPDEPLLVAAQSDLDIDGRLEPHWLLVRAATVQVVGSSWNTEHSSVFQYNEVTKFDLRSTVGSSVLRVQVNEVFIDLVRFSNSYRERFNRVYIQLERLRNGEPLQLEALTKPSAEECPVCGLVLAASAGHCPRCLQQGTVMRRMLGLLKPYLIWIVVMLGLMVLRIGLDMVPPFLTKILVDDVLNVDAMAGLSEPELAQRRWTLLFVVSALISAAVCGTGINIILRRIEASVGTAITFDVRQAMFQRLEEMTVDFYDRNQVGSLMSRLTKDVEALQEFISQLTQGFVINILMIIGIGVMLFYLNPTLALYVMVPIPFVIGGTMFFWRKVYPKYFKLWDSHSKLASMLNGVLSGIRTVKAFAQESRERQRFTTNTAYMRDTRRTVMHQIGTFNPIMALLFGLGGFIIWYVGGTRVLSPDPDSKITLGTLIAYLGYIGMFYAPLTNLTLFSNWVTAFMSASQRIFEVLDSQPSLREKPDADCLPEVTGHIKFENVTFGYDPYTPILKNISFEIQPGEMIGIVGRSGSGKTTIINLLCRFYDPQQGRILIEGHDLRDITRKDLRQHIGLVLQEPFLFRASIEDNIAYGRPDASPVEIMNAARAANSHDFIMQQPAGYDTRLGERGAGLSGGERQRISIARALLCNPAILVLDEATSNVDTESEQQIQKALATLCKGRTTIAIAHRLSTLRGADRIIVIDGGTVDEQGSHDELMAQHGIYYRLVKIQTDLAALEQE